MSLATNVDSNTFAYMDVGGKYVIKAIVSLSLLGDTEKQNGGDKNAGVTDSL